MSECKKHENKQARIILCKQSNLCQYSTGVLTPANQVAELCLTAVLVVLPTCSH